MAAHCIVFLRRSQSLNKTYQVVRLFLTGHMFWQCSDNSLLDANAKVLICDIVACADKRNKLNVKPFKIIKDIHLKGRIVQSFPVFSFILSLSLFALVIEMK